jgi:hypothetical protein
LEHNHGGNIGGIHLDGLAGFHGARILAIDVFSHTIQGIGVVLLCIGEVWTCGLPCGRALEGGGEGGEIWTLNIIASRFRSRALRG